MTLPISPGSTVPPQRIPRGQLALVLLQAAVRLALGGLVIAAMMTLAPEEADVTIALPLALGVGATVLYIWFVRHQMRGVARARYPMIRAGEALVLSAAMFLALFAMSYVLISTDNPEAFSEPLNSFSAYYFSLTVLATVGFGDIAPNTVAARSVTMVQMALDIAFIAVTFRVMSGAARKALAERGRAPGVPPAAGEA